MPMPIAAIAWLSCSWLALQHAACRAWDPQPDGYEVLDGPPPAQSPAAWRQQWSQWRRMELQAARYDAHGACTIYNQPASAWTQRNLVQAFVMLHDRRLFDRRANAFTPESFIRELQARVGRLDSVLLWSSYPTIGIDSRNQWDYLRAVPGGLAGLQQLIAAFHEHGIRVFVPYNPWDTATRDESGREDVVRMYQADIQMLEVLLPQIGADGFNGDTMYGVPRSFFNCSKPMVATPEGGVPTAALADNPISWGYFWGYTHFPPVSRAKFLEPRHMVQICARWSLDRTTELHMALFNGVGYVVWENVWGIWNAMTARESEATKRVFHMLRKFADWTTSDGWIPYAVRESNEQVYGSAFAHREKRWAARLITLINVATTTQVIHLPLHLTLDDGDGDASIPTAASSRVMSPLRVFDVFQGIELPVQSVNVSTVRLSLEPRGYGAVLITELPPDDVIPALDEFLKQRQEMTRVPLSSFSMQRELLRQEITKTETNPLPPAASSPDHASDMVKITGCTNWWFNVSSVQIEPVHAWTPNWADYGAGVQFPWEHRPWTNHSVRLLIPDFWLDRYPTTNKQFFTFLQKSAYEPISRERFLAHWEHRIDASTGALRPVREWRVPAGLERSPVVYVSYEDAMAFAAFYHKRLPHDWEWQYVASNGEQYNRYPYGNVFDASKHHAISRSKNPPLPDAVGSHPGSRSTRDGVEDLVGFVWQMTDQMCDTHTCGVLLRGGSFYRPVASTLGDPNWYFPQALQTTQHNRLLQFSEDADRSPFVCFRCAQSMS